MKKALFICALSLLVKFSIGQGFNWERMNTLGTHGIEKMSFVNDTGYILAGNGNLITTTDGGLTFKVKYIAFPIS